MNNSHVKCNVEFERKDTSFGQLNPVNNLEWDQWYEWPNNSFILSWDLPGPLQDTVIGYNVCRGTSQEIETTSQAYKPGVVCCLI